MNSKSHNPSHNPMTSAANSGEETLRLIASQPAPAGLEERVHEALRATPRKGQVLAWPEGLRAKTVLENHWIRTAAAAAIAFVVVGGGWGVYSRVEQGKAAKVVVMPLRVPASGGFSSAGAIRTPETLPGPRIREQATPAGKNRLPWTPAGTKPPQQGTREQETQPAKKAAGQKRNQNAQPASQVAPQPAVSQ